MASLQTLDDGVGRGVGVHGVRRDRHHRIAPVIEPLRQLDQ